MFVLLLISVVSFAKISATAFAAEGVALAIVYDTSGSMKEFVRDKTGKSTAKDVIGRRALDALVVQLRNFVTNAPAGTTRQIETSLIAFSAEGARVIVPLSPFDPAKAAEWSKQLPRPDGGTPLGNASKAGAQMVLKSELSRKHVLVITDGLNTVGPAPEALLAPLMKQAEKAGTPLFTHFVAFDVDAKQFAPVKKLGATVVGAADETQLNTQITFILEEKILLEAEEPTKK